MVGIYNFEVFEYKRGDKWSVRCVVNGVDNISYHDIKKPEGASKELLQKFLDEAEIATLKQIDASNES